ncbi:MAG: hypothetical protein ACI9XO_002792, partial [Paraglaciecola sp.]
LASWRCHFENIISLFLQTVSSAMRLKNLIKLSLHGTHGF